MERGKGINRAIQWSRQTGTKLDFYGYGSQLEQVPRSMFRGALDPEEVPEILSMYSTFVFLPDLPEPFGRTAVEAGLAGCTLILNGNVGATDWMGNCQAIRESCDAFWNLILSKVKVRGRR
jgi:glycosyltransferase involved in cell wall biosynthesis